MADEHALFRDVAKFLQNADGAAKGTYALAAWIWNDENFFCKRAY